MPVTDLADYLGMPQQAPEDPLFYQKQREAAYAQDAEDFNQQVAAIGELRRLKRQAPILQAQQAQIAYDKVAQDARDLRMKQEIEAQVERAANELAGGNLNPESDDFGAKYRDLATRNPLAFSDPRFSNVAGLYAAQNQNYQAARKQQMDAEARAAQARIDAENSAYAFGVPAGRITPEMSIRDINIERGKVKTAGIGTRGGAKDVAGQMMQRDYELVDSEVKRLKEEGEDVIYDANGVVSPNPEFQKLSEERNRLFNKLRGSYQGIYSPAQTPSVQPTTQQQVSVNPNARLSPLYMLPQGSLPAMAGALPTPQAPKVIQEEQIDSTEEILNTDLGIPGNAEFIANKVREESLSLDARKQVLKKLEDAIKNPPSMKYLNRYQVDATKQSIANAYSNIKNGLALAETQEKIVNPVWTRAKKTMESTVNEWAKKNGYEPETIWQTILQESESGPAREVDPLSESGEKILPLTAEEILGEELSKENADLLTVKPQIEAIRNAEAPVGARIGRFFGEESITNYDILKQIAKEKFKPVATSTKESPTGMPLTEQQQKDLNKLKGLVRSK